MKTIIKIGSIGIVIILIVSGLLFLTKISNQRIENARKGFHGPDIIPSDYLALIGKDSQKDITNTFTHMLKDTLELVTICKYKNKYSLLLYKLDFYTEGSLINSYKEKHSSFISDITLYNVVRAYNFKLLFKELDGAKPKTGIYVTYDGNPFVHVCKNDSIINVNGICNKFSIGYNENSNKDVVSEMTPDGLQSNALPMSFLYIKRNNACYFMLMSVINKEDTLPSDLLYKLVNEK